MRWTSRRWGSTRGRAVASSELLDGLPQTISRCTHDLHLVRDLFPRTVILDRGRIVADGPTSEILADTALLEKHGLEAP